MNLIVQFTTAIAVLTVLTSGPASMALGEEIFKDTDARALNPLSTLGIAGFKSFIDRPLFSSTRSLPEDPVSTDDNTVAAITSPNLNIRLLGIVVTQQGAIARVLDVDDGTTHSLREGETFNDWEVVAIDAAALRFSKDGEATDFTVFKVAAKPQLDSDVEGDPAPKDPPAVTQTPRVVRVVKPWPGTDDAQTAKDSSSRHAQDLIDFFGPDAGKAE